MGSEAILFRGDGRFRARRGNASPSDPCVQVAIANHDRLRPCRRHLALPTDAHISRTGRPRHPPIAFDGQPRPSPLSLVPLAKRCLYRLPFRLPGEGSPRASLRAAKPADQSPKRAGTLQPLPANRAPRPRRPRIRPRSPRLRPPAPGIVRLPGAAKPNKVTGARSSAARWRPAQAGRQSRAYAHGPLHNKVIRALNTLPHRATISARDILAG